MAVGVPVGVHILVVCVRVLWFCVGGGVEGERRGVARQPEVAGMMIPCADWDWPGVRFALCGISPWLRIFPSSPVSYLLYKK